MISLKNNLFFILAVTVLSACQNISTQSCTNTYTIPVVNRENAEAIPIGKSNDECLQVKSRTKNFDVIYVNFELKNEEWLRDEPEQLKNFSVKYALDIYRENNENENIEAVIIGFKKQLGDAGSVRHFEFSSRDLKDMQ